MGAARARARGAAAPLVVYGVGDIVTDMVFNVVGGLVVALWGSDYVGGVTDFLRDRLGGGEDPPGRRVSYRSPSSSIVRSSLTRW